MVIACAAGAIGMGVSLHALTTKLAMSNLTVRILVAVVGIPLIVAITVVGGWWLATFVALVSAVGAGEIFHMTQRKGIRPYTTVGMASAGILALLLTTGRSEPIFTLLTAVCMLTFALQLRRGIKDALTTVATTILGVLYPAILLTWIVPLRQWQGVAPTDGMWLLLSLLSGIWLCDTAAYFVGRFLGKHLLAPSISPKKTWEGAIAGATTSVMWCGTIIPLVLPWGTPWLGIAIGLLIGTVGQAGDLAKSLLKRDVAIKDSSAIIPGHGGVLDRFDSLMATAPAVYALLVLLRSMDLVP